jgi:hypothetical protein
LGYAVAGLGCSPHLNIVTEMARQNRFFGAVSAKSPHFLRQSGMRYGSVGIPLSLFV